MYCNGTAWIVVSGSGGGSGGGSLPSGAANLVVATPNGSSGSSGLRALVAQDLPGEYYATSTGAANTYAVAPTNAVTAYATGEQYVFKSHLANTGPASVNYSGVGAAAIKKPQGGVTTDLAPNDILPNQIVVMRYDGTNMQIVSQLGNAVTVTVASGTAALGTSAIASGACATVVTVSAMGVTSADSIIVTPNASIKAVTGYVPLTAGGLTITPYPAAGNVNFDVCNWSSGSITPGAVTLNWRVVR
jgi:hypothetical protein